MTQCERNQLPYFGPDKVARFLRTDTFIDRVRVHLREDVSMPLRQRIDGHGGRELLLMPCVSRRFGGVKSLTLTPANAALGKPVIQGVYVLFDNISGSPLATIDAEELTKYRTAAVAAIAADSLARSDASRVLLVGSGALVPYLAWGYAQVRRLTQLDLWGRNPTKTAAAAERIRVFLPDARIAVRTDLAAAVGDANIVSLATRATRPLLLGAWLRAGTHVDMVGGYRPDMREVDDEAIASGPLYVDTRQGCLAEAGDLIIPLRDRVIGEGAIAGDITALLDGTRRQSDREITLFKTVGMAGADLAAARLVWQGAS